MCYYVVFGSISVALTAILYHIIYDNTIWNPYAVWIAAWTITAFFMYGFDWLLTKMGNIRTPDHIFYALAALGGFPGAWLGIFVFQGKIDFNKNMWLLVVLILNMLGHGLLTYNWFVRPLI